VLLLECTEILGGAITQNLVYPLMTFHSAPDRQIIHGLAEELIRKVKARGGSPGHIPDPLGCVATITPVDAEIFREVVTEELRNAGVEVWVGSKVTGVLPHPPKSPFSLEGEKGDLKCGIHARRIIDATGNADVAALAGAPFIFGREGDQKTQPLTLIFHVGNIDQRKVRAYIREHPKEFVLSDSARSDLDQFPFLAVSGFFSLVKRAQEEDGWIRFRDRVLYFDLLRPGEISVNMTRVAGVDGTHPDEVARAQEMALIQVHECMKFFKKYLPGFENAELLRVAPKIGIRESRHIIGEYTLTEEDVISGRKFDDSSACGAFPIDIHSPDGQGLTFQKMVPGTFYEIPFRCMVPKGMKGFLVTGRAISATHSASASARLMPTCMMLGEAAGMGERKKLGSLDG
jgi:hypothetical protein